MEGKQYFCEKCGGTSYKEDRFHATGSNFSKLFDIQDKKFITISCRDCGFSELYKSRTSTGMNILDFLINK